MTRLVNMVTSGRSEYWEKSDLLGKKSDLLVRITTLCFTRRTCSGKTTFVYHDDPKEAWNWEDAKHGGQLVHGCMGTSYDYYRLNLIASC